MSTSAAAPLVATPLTFGGDDDDDDDDDDEPSSPPMPFHARDRARIVALSATEGHKTFRSWGRMWFQERSRKVSVAFSLCGTSELGFRLKGLELRVEG
jgi:hypothetical protein